MQVRLIAALLITTLMLGTTAYFLDSPIPWFVILGEFLLAFVAFVDLRSPSRETEKLGMTRRTLPRVIVRAMYVVLLLTLFTQSYWRGVTLKTLESKSKRRTGNCVLVRLG